MIRGFYENEGLKKNANIVNFIDSLFERRFAVGANIEDIASLADFYGEVIHQLTIPRVLVAMNSNTSKLYWLIVEELVKILTTGKGTTSPEFLFMNLELYSNGKHTNERIGSNVKSIQKLALTRKKLEDGLVQWFKSVDAGGNPAGLVDAIYLAKLLVLDARQYHRYNCSCC